MKTLTDFALRHRYAAVRERRPRLDGMSQLIDWDAFRPFLPQQPQAAGRRRLDPIMMLKCLFLQRWYPELSDEELEFQIADRLSFQAFLEFPASPPDHSTIWKFREQLADGERLDQIWDELNRQLATHGVHVTAGVVQDARFVTADPGKARNNTGRGRAAKTSRQADATWTKKNTKRVFGYKHHTKVCATTKIITAVATTAAHVHDNRIDLATENEVVYRDKGYFGARTRARGNATMDRATRSHPLTIQQRRRNRRISTTRCRGEHPYATMSRTFGTGRTRLTTLWRVHTQNVLESMLYNLHRAFFLLAT
jgi:IS5 family transposase